MQLQLR